MASLTLGFVKNSLGYSSQGFSDVSIRAGLVARVTQLLDAASKQPREPASKEIVIPVGRSDVELEVDPGYYGVEVVLPSGELLTKDADLRQKVHEDVRFDERHSPHEWLSWQHLEGAVPSAREYYSSQSQPMLRSPRGVVGSSPRRSPDGPILRRTGAPSPITVHRDSIGMWPEALPRPAQDGFSSLRIFRRPLPNSYEQHDLTQGLTWLWLVDSLEDRSPDWVTGGWLQPAPEVKPFRIGSDHVVESWRTAGFKHDNLYFALVRTPYSVELVRLPLPWPEEGMGDLIEFTVDKSEQRRPSRTNVSLLDPSFFGLLSYLKSGSFALGRTMIEKGLGKESVLELLYDKRQNPMAAAGSALCLLASSDLSTSEQWHQWISNLNDWFEWLPDGAVAQGRLLLAQGEDQQKQARDAFLRAYQRGLPFYTLGLSWLLEGLSRFDDAECQSAAELLRRVAVRSDVSQAFTVLRVGPPGGF